MIDAQRCGLFKHLYFLMKVYIRFRTNKFSTLFTSVNLIFAGLFRVSLFVDLWDAEDLMTW